MEFLEDEPRPRFLLQSGPDLSDADSNSTTTTLLKTSRLHLALCLLSSFLVLLSALRLSASHQTLFFLLSWSSLSFILAPFAPLALTGGDARVGLGDPLPDPEPAPADLPDASTRRRSRPQKPDLPPAVANYVNAAESTKKAGRSGDGGGEKGGRQTEAEVTETEWSEDDFEILRKQMAKHPVGTARRWELIAGAFGGRHGVKGVIAAAKSMGERKPAADDSFRQFLRKRKPVDGRIEGGSGEGSNGAVLENGDHKEGESAGVKGMNGTVNWSSGEDLALLNALKVFPKDTSMRWEKIAAAVPGKSKACCMKRVAELKRDFRSLKASEA